MKFHSHGIHVRNVNNELQAASEMAEQSYHQSVPGDVQDDADVHSEDASSYVESHGSVDNDDASDSSSSTHANKGMEHDISQVVEDENYECHI